MPAHPETGALAVGRTVPHTATRIVGEDGGQLGPGEAGEVAIKGPQVVPGYWENPEETANTFRDGFMHTGDIGILDDDGWLYLVDRKKDMIVASGFKVWPREVEDVLYEHPAVREAAVIGVPDEYRGETVWGYVSMNPGRASTRASSSPSAASASPPTSTRGSCTSSTNSPRRPRARSCGESCATTPAPDRFRSAADGCRSASLAPR